MPREGRARLCATCARGAGARAGISRLRSRPHAHPGSGASVASCNRRPPAVVGLLGKPGVRSRKPTGAQSNQPALGRDVVVLSLECAGSVRETMPKDNNSRQRECWRSLESIGICWRGLFHVSASVPLITQRSSVQIRPPQPAVGKQPPDCLSARSLSRGIFWARPVSVTAGFLPGRSSWRRPSTTLTDLAPRSRVISLTRLSLWLLGEGSMPLAHGNQSSMLSIPQHTADRSLHLFKDSAGKSASWRQTCLRPESDGIVTLPWQILALDDDPTVQDILTVFLGDR